LSSKDRRDFLKVMGASLAFAGLGMSGCRRWPEEKIAPFALQPASRMPGVPVQYATTMEICGVSQGLLVTSFDGRPIKVEGNPLHPLNQGSTDLYAQASILDLYDPDRSQSVRKNGEPATWENFTAWAASQFAAGLAGVAILSEASSSPSVAAMRRKATEAGARWFQYEPIGSDHAIQGSVMAFGSAMRPHYHFDKASVVVAIDSDFLHCDPASIQWTRDWAKGRRADDRKTMSRLYAFESTVSLTGANADHRIALRSADIAIIAAKMASAVAPNAATGEMAINSVQAVVPRGTLDDTLHHLIADLKQNMGRSIVIVGERQPAEVHLLAHLMNTALGNVGQTITFSPSPETAAQDESIVALAEEINAGRVTALVMIGGNPAYNAPADLGFADLIAKVPASVHLSDYFDETSSRCTWHVNRAHYLETWGDGTGLDGTVSLGQPMIEPLFTGKSALELLAVMGRDELQNGYDIVRRTFAGSAGEALDEAAWRKALHDGVVVNGVPASAPPQVAGANVADQLKGLQQRWAAPKNEELEVVFVPDMSVLDGRFANNGWLQELPDPITKVTWDNAVLMNPATGKARGIKTGDMVNVKVGNREVNAAAMLLPGQYAGSVTVKLGYGREMQGRICAGAGFNFYPLRSSDAMGFASGTVSKISGQYKFATTQDHHAVDSVGGQGTQERLPTLFREASLKDYADHPDFAKHRTHVVHRLSLWEEDHPFHSEEGRAGGQYAWAMSIDLNACTGCNACVIACQAENNIPIVGKDQISRGREMHWIRIDRYFKGGAAENESYPDGFMLAPVACVHCENAPCEQVCPVAATVHDTDGLNVMVYNRCIGTRYCSNNCPYKVRRFNYFDYHARDPHRENPGSFLHVKPEYYTKGQAVADPLKQMQFNPEVTVRMRGIMEKCTYCVQRIAAGRIQAKNAWVQANPNDRSERVAPIVDGTVTPACAQACPAQAIVFGDLNDKSSRVSKLHKHERSYQMLEELNTKPRTRYMARLRNPAFGETASHDGHGHGHDHDGHDHAHDAEAKSHG